MRRSNALVTLMLVTVAGTTELAGAQTSTRAPQFGVDGGVAFNLNGPGVTVVSLPMQRLRVGVPFSDQASFKTALAVNAVNGGGVSFTTYNVELGVPLYPNADASAARGYLRPFAGVAGASGDNAGPTRTTFGAGVGIESPIDSRFGLRWEANFTHALATSSVKSSDTLALTVGLSFKPK